MKLRRITAVLLALILALGMLPVSAFAAASKDLSECRVLFDGREWNVFVLDAIDEGHSMDEIREFVELIDADDETVPKNAYDLVFGMYPWDDEAEENIFTEVPEPYGLTCSPDYMQAGFGDFAVYAVAREGSGYTGTTGMKDFMMWHKYSLNYFGAQIDFGEEYRRNSTWFWHDYYELPENDAHEPVVCDIAGERIDPALYTATYYVRNTELPAFDDPDYESKIYPDKEPLDGMPSERGSYYVRIVGKEPYYGGGCVDFDIVEPRQPESCTMVRGSDRRYYEGDTIYIPEGGDAYICFSADPWPDGLVAGWRSDLLEKQGFTVDKDAVFIEGDDRAFAHVSAGDLPAGAEGTLYYNWYSYEDIFIRHIPWSEAPIYMSSSVNIRVGDEPDPETVAFIYGEEDMRYLSGDTIEIHNGEDILLTFDLTYYPDFLLGDRSLDGLREAGFTVVQEIVSYEDAGFKYHWIRADDLAPGTRATIPCEWYLFEDYFDKENHEPLYHGEITIEVADDAPSGYLLGDADCDGEVSIVDVTVTQRWLLDIPVPAFYEAAADVNRSGEADIADTVAIQRALIELPADADVDEEGVYGTYFAAWNIGESRLPADCDLEGAERARAEAEIRTALDLLVDRRTFKDAVGLCRMPASSFVPDYISDADGEPFFSHASDGDYDGYFDVNDYDSCREKALEILKKYYTFDESTGKFTDVPVMSYAFNQGAVHEAIGRWISDAYAAYGIELELEPVDWNSYYEILGSGDFSLARDGWVENDDDPMLFLTMWTSCSEDNIAGIGKGAHADEQVYSLDLRGYGIDYAVENGTWSQTYDVLIDMIRSCRSKAVRYRLMHLAEDMVMETGCILPIYYY